MKKIFLILGETGAGKTEIYKRVLAANKTVKAVVSTTTRAKRKGEVEGIDYNFVSDEEFHNRIDEFLEYREYKLEDDSIVFYGTRRDSFDEEGSYIHIVDGNGLIAIEKYIKELGLPGHTVVSIYINANESIRRERSLNRDNMSAKKIREIERRIYADAFEVRTFRNNCCLCLKNESESDLDTAVQVIDSMINAMSM